MKHWSVLLTGAFLGVSAFFLAPRQVHAAEPERAGEGVYIEDLNVSGMNREEISQAVQTRLAELQQDSVQLLVGGTTVTVSAGELGLSWTNPEVVQEALELGQKGNVLERFRTEKYLEERGALVLEMDLAADEESVRKVVENKCASLNTSAVDRYLIHEADGSFSVGGGQDGFSVKVDETVAKVVDYMGSQWHGGQGAVAVETDVVAAQGDAEQLSLVQDVLGSGSTEYQMNNEGRNTNVVVGTAKISGVTLYPGEEYSVCDAMVPFTAENGYEPAPSYEMGEVVDTYGGGVCQVSTTLYQAVLQAELEVTERSAHSMLVHYVDPSMDAAIAENVKDFRFVNNTDAPIYIEGTAGDGTISFTIYGHETRDPSRVVTYESEVVSTEPITDVFQADSTAAFGEISVDYSAYEGMTARLWKVVTVNGEEESREQVNSSTYQMVPNTYRVGTAGGSAEAVAALQAAIAANNLEQVQAVIAQYPGGQANTSGTEKSSGQTDAQGQTAAPASTN